MPAQSLGLRHVYWLASCVYVWYVWLAPHGSLAGLQIETLLVLAVFVTCLHAAFMPDSSQTPPFTTHLQRNIPIMFHV